jgi:hypothetical protein
MARSNSPINTQGGGVAYQNRALRQPFVNWTVGAQAEPLGAAARRSEAFKLGDRLAPVPDAIDAAHGVYHEKAKDINKSETGGLS